VVSTAGARWLVLASALLFSTGGAAIKTAAFSAAQVSAVRSGIAAVVLAVYLQSVRGGRLTITRGLLTAGVLYATTLTLFVAANKLTTAANAIFIQAAAPLYILVLGPPVLGERWTSRDLAHVGALAVGLALCFAGQQAPSVSAPDPATGNLLAALAGATWAGTLLFLRHLGKSGTDETGGLRAVIVGNVMAFLVAVPFAWPPPSAPAAAWATVVYLGVFQIGLAYVFFTRAIRRVSALEASLLLLIEPVLNPMWTWLVHGESPGGFTIVGGGVIVAATAFHAVTSPSS
jgi:drug/metabolite transporter (DMT)-like permease